MSKTARYIDQQNEFEEWCQKQLGSIDLLAIDTEFLRVKTYFPKLCLIQLATRTEMVCIDPLVLTDPAPLVELLLAPDILKIIHSAHQDLETLVHELDILPTPLYDTQIAITRLEIGDNLMSYQAMVSHFLKVELKKDQARTEWDRRPLSPRQIEYAYNDVRYLIECYDAINQLIQEKNIRHQLDNDFAILTKIEHYQPNIEDAWKRVKGKNRLNSKERALLQRLAAVRERLAIQKDLPKRWLIKDHKLIDIARKFVNEAHSVDDDGLINTYKTDIADALKEAITHFHAPSQSDNESAAQ